MNFIQRSEPPKDALERRIGISHLQIVTGQIFTHDIELLFNKNWTVILDVVIMVSEVNCLVKLVLSAKFDKNLVYLRKQVSEQKDNDQLILSFDK